MRLSTFFDQKTLAADDKTFLIRRLRPACISCMPLLVSGLKCRRQQNHGASIQYLPEYREGAEVSRMVQQVQQVEQGRVQIVARLKIETSMLRQTGRRSQLRANPKYTHVSINHQPNHSARTHQIIASLRFFSHRHSYDLLLRPILPHILRPQLLHFIVQVLPQDLPKPIQNLLQLG